MEEQVFIVDEEHHKCRLDIYLTHILTNIPSRNFVKHLIESQHVTVNDNHVKSHQKVSSGDKVSVHIPPIKTVNDLPPENIPLDIFYEDPYLLIVNKPHGLLVHPVNEHNTSGTLVNALLYYCKTLSDFNRQVRPGIVHRLDKETSGLILIAKDNITHARLARQFEKHKVKKQYVALVEGTIEFDEGVIEEPIGRHPRYHDRKVIAFDDSAKKAKTQYRVKKRFKNATLVALYPETGRTHQLRVHLAHLGHPVLGDDKYGKKNSFHRMALHAQSIGFTHPHNKKHLECSTVVPKDFLNFQ